MNLGRKKFLNLFIKNKLLRNFAVYNILQEKQTQNNR